MTRAGYDPSGMVSFFQKLDALSREKGGRGPAFFSTHPLPAERVRNMQAEIDKLRLTARPGTSGRSLFETCRNQLRAIPLPPPGQDKPLGAAVASLETDASSTNVQVSGRPAQTRKLTVPGNTTWFDTGIDLAAGQPLEVKASGSIYCRKNSDEACDPWGIPGTNKGFWKPLSKVNTGALVARIGNATETTFAVGGHRIIRSPAAGRLFLGINDDNNFDNRGSYDAEVAAYR